MLCVNLPLDFTVRTYGYVFSMHPAIYRICNMSRSERGAFWNITIEVAEIKTAQLLEAEPFFPTFS